MTQPASTALRFEKIEKRYGGLFALRRVSLDIATGECVALAGRNGSGKTTLLRIAARIVRPSAGTLSFPNASESAVALQPGYVGHSTMVYDELTAEENLLLFARLMGVAEPGKRVDELLDAVSLAERRKSLVRTFSRGMRQRIAIARALLHRPSVLLLDEPSTGLDSLGIGWLQATLTELRAQGSTILMSLHGESELSALASRAIRLDAGTVVADTASGLSVKEVLALGGGRTAP